MRPSGVDMKMTQFIWTFLTLVAVVLSTQVSNAQELGSTHVTSPHHYQVLLENDKVLVLKMTLAPGEGDN